MDTDDLFKYLGQAYFHEDYREEHGSPTQTVHVFAMENTLETVGMLRHELAERLDAGLTEKGASRLWLHEFDAMYDPGAEGLTYVGWLRTVEHLLSAAEKERAALNAV